MKIFIIIVIAVILGEIIRRFLSHEKHSTFLSSDTPITSMPVDVKQKIDANVPDRPVSFGYKCVWIAVNNNDGNQVSSVAGLKNKIPCNWTTGIDRAYEDEIFVTPPVDGWTFLVGWGLPKGDTKESISDVETILNKLSSKFGEAQFFGTHRVVGYVCWIRSLYGEIKRAYVYVGGQGENLVVAGEPTEVEKKYNLVNTFSREAEDPKYFETADLIFPDEDEVMEIAGAWSINPTTLENRVDVEPALGYIGRI
jgi:hypothetical protein